ncbi:MAG: helix-turn-helix domain-containing protein [Deltaproteobacteria bacterium]|jgi:DNA-binding transcriptional MerR regulator|nr:helix-turn-helix domain-containing protein [Deltaproteobacteria bacterium]
MQTTFAIEDLARLTSYSKRTIRYYVQLGLVDRPVGEGRGAHYTTEHLRELLDIRKLTENGLSLEAVKFHLRQESLGVKGGFARKPGAVQVQSRVCLGPGLDVLVTPDETVLTPDEVRDLIRGILDLTRKFSEQADRPSARPGLGRLLVPLPPPSLKGGAPPSPGRREGPRPSGRRRN